MEAAPGREDESLDALRRRLYRPDATAEDLRRYEAARAAVPPPPPTEPPDPAPTPAAPPPARRPRRTPLIPVAVVVALGLAGGVAGVLALQRQPQSVADAPVHPSYLERELAGPERPVSRVGSGRTVQEFRGRGTGTAVLDSAALPPDGGRLDLLLTLGETGPVRWSVLRAGIGAAHGEPTQVLVMQTRNQTRAVPVPVSFPYAGGPPTAIHVAVPDGVAWGLVVARSG